MTTDHLPECETYRKEIGYVCICGLLRACEQRVRARYSAYLNADNEGSYAAGFRDAMHAAREAVERVSSLLQPLGPALAAIDELRNSPSLPPTTGRAHKY